MGRATTTHYWLSLFSSLSSLESHCLDYNRELSRVDQPPRIPLTSPSVSGITTTTGTSTSTKPRDIVIMYSRCSHLELPCCQGVGKYGFTQETSFSATPTRLIVFISLRTYFR